MPLSWSAFLHLTVKHGRSRTRSNCAPARANSWIWSSANMCHWSYLDMMSNSGKRSGKLQSIMSDRSRLTYLPDPHSQSSAQKPRRVCVAHHSNVWGVPLTLRHRDLHACQAVPVVAYPARVNGKTCHLEFQEEYAA